MLGTSRETFYNLLEIKAKADTGDIWTEAEASLVEQCLERNDPLSVLAACVILVSHRPEGCVKSLKVLEDAIQHQDLPNFAEFAIYEALLYLRPVHLSRLAGLLPAFFESSFNNRRISLNNAVIVLGKLARIDRTQWFSHLKALENDIDPQIRHQAFCTLKWLERSTTPPTA